MGSGEGFFGYFVEQDFPEVLVLLAAVAGAYAVLVLAVVRLARRRLASGVGVAVAAGTCAALAVFVVGLTLFEAAALYYRHVPPGDGVQRHGADLERFYRAAALGFTMLYALVALAGAAAAALVARRESTRIRPAAAAALALVALFLVLTLPLVEFQNACDGGRPLLVDRWGNC